MIRIALSLLATLFLATHANAAETECDIYLGAELASPRGQCRETAKALQSAEITRLQTELQRKLLEAAADFAFETDTAPYDSYAIELPSLEFFPMCCKDDPSDLNAPLDCQPQNADGSCPSGTDRYLCSVSGGEELELTCTNIDD